MRTDATVKRSARGRGIALVAALMLAAVWRLHADSSEHTPPPAGVTDPDLLEHLLAPKLGHWTRVGEVRALDGSPESGDAVGPLADAQRYDLVLGGEATYRAPGGGVDANATVLIMRSRMDALGVFAARRPDSPESLSLASPAFWDGEALEVHADRVYMHVALALGHEVAQALMEDLALQLERRLPARERPPRLMRLLPRRWLNPYTMLYGPGEVCGFAPEGPFLTGTYELGREPVTVAVIEATGPGGARRQYTRLLEHVLGMGRAREIQDLAEEAFVCEATGLGACVGLWQDEFVGWAVTNGDASDAEAVMRLVALRVRITRPLPHLDGSE